MARILVYTSPGRGHLYPMVPVLQALQGRGHDIVLRTLKAEVVRMAELGFHAAAVTVAIEAIVHEDHQAGNPVAAVRRAVATFCRRAPHELREMREAISAIGPDLVLADINCFGAMAAAEAWGGPWAIWTPYPLPAPSRDAPPFGPGLRPATGPLGRLRDAVARPLISGPYERIMTPRVNEIRAAAGLRALDSGSDVLHRPHLNLYMTAEPFEYPRTDWPANVRMVGPCAWEPPSSATLPFAEPGDPLVLVTTSSEFQDDGVLARTALRALADQPLRVVVTVPAGDPADFDVPPNAVVLRFAPHGPLLDRAICAVTHGGMGATQKALVRGVPVCVVPFGRDQLEVARRVEHSRSGTRLPARRLRADRLRASVLEAIDRREGAGGVARAFAVAGGPAAAADALEHLLTYPATIDDQST
jgi:MGT family glycosyltransferase